jgi:chemotaxis protein methyltransferase CheR
VKEAFAWSDHWQEQFRRICASRWGFRYRPDDMFTLSHVVERSFQASSAPTLEAFANELETLPETDPEVQAFIGQMVVGETSFFRNQAQFAALAEHIIPDLVAQRRLERRFELRIWSAGCASGEEPYSVAILLAALIPDWRDWNIRIVATDINPFALRRANDALYSEWSFRGADPTLVERFFTRVSRLRKLTHPCKDLVTFRRQNLAVATIPAPDMGIEDLDVILCRNVTIYFDRDLTERLATSFYRALAPGGWLVVGHTEPDATVYRQFETVEFPDTILYQRPLVEAPPLVERDEQTAPAPGPPPPPVPTPVPSDGPTPSLAEALAVYEAGDLSGAYELLFQVASREPRDAIAPHLLAQVSADEKRYDEALFWSFTALQRDPFHVPTLLLMGVVLLERGDPERAKQKFQQALFNDTMCPEAHLYLSLAYRALGRDDLAERSRERAGRLARDATLGGALLPVQRARLTLGATHP